MRIASFMPSNPFWRQALLQLGARFPSHEFINNPGHSQAAVAGLNAIIATRLDPSVYQSVRQLRAIFLPITGLDHLPIDWFITKGVDVFNVHAQAAGVAQCALAMTLAFYGRLVEYHNDLRQGRWHGLLVREDPVDQWETILGRPAAIFGTGAIGQALARMLKAFDCPVTGYRRRPDGPVPPGFDQIEPDLARTVQGAELLFLTLPLTPATLGLFNKDLLMAAKGKFLVNVGRGGLVDEEGLYGALHDGVLKGAAIDTWYTYPPKGSANGPPSRFPIQELPNVVLSPHIGSSTRDGAERAVQETVENLSEWLQTGRCRRQVDLHEKY
jgi:phosphoglycerate dehydrogenase-like enzyme